MRTHPNDGGGTTLILTADDDLSAIPESHLDIVTQEIREAFGDPHSYFEAIADRTSIAELARYLRRFVDEGRWALMLADTYMMEHDTIGAFHWSHPHQHFSLLGPGSSTEYEGFSALYQDIQLVHWDSIGFAGGILFPSYHIPLSAIGCPSTNPVFPPDSTTVFGNSSCGDMMVYNSDKDAGYLSHENGTSYVVGTIPEMLDWIFAELAANRTPEFDYRRC